VALQYVPVANLVGYAQIVSNKIIEPEMEEFKKTYFATWVGALTSAEIGVYRRE
jgi:hypothetical protein